MVARRREWREHLPIPDAEYPAFYPIGIKASCMCGEGIITTEKIRMLWSPCDVAKSRPAQNISFREALGFENNWCEMT
jgi:hypothetical protein